MAPVPDVAAISFARSYDKSGTGVSLIDERQSFRPGREIAWRVFLPSVDGSQTVHITVEAVSSGAVVASTDFVPEAGSNVFYGQSALASLPGTYVMRYYVDGLLLGEGEFEVRQSEQPQANSDPDPTPRPEPDPTPKPKKPRGGGGGGGNGNCDPSYPSLCIPPNAADIDCGEISARNFRVRQPDPHGFDGDYDGIGCES